jgi:hypothetical protein
MKTRIVTLLIAFLAISIPGIGGILYDDGPIDGQNNAWFIDGPGSGPYSQWIADQFVATGSGIAGSLDAGIWVTAGTTPTTLSWWLGTAPLIGDLSSGVVAQVSYVYVTTYGSRYDVFNVHVTGLSGLIQAGNTYFLTLGGGNNSTGNQFVSWDVNGGPATCSWGVYDCGGGEAFTLYSGSAVPEPSTITLIGTGLLAVAGALRRKRLA